MSIRWMGSSCPSFSAYGNTSTAKNLSMMSFNDHPFFFFWQKAEAVVAEI